jgi:hypothetical protein
MAGEGGSSPETSAPVTQSPAESPQASTKTSIDSVEKTTANISIGADKAVESLETKVGALKAQEAEKENIGEKNISKGRDDVSKAPENAKDQAQLQKGFGFILDDPSYQKIFAEKVSQAQSKGENPDLKTLQVDTLADYFQQKSEEVAEKIEIQQGEPLTEEQQGIISKEFESAFKTDRKGMDEITKKALDLTKARAEEIKLKADKTVADEQILEAIKTVTELREVYDTLIKEKFGEKDSELRRYLEEVSNNSNILVLLQKAKNKSLLRIILEIVATIASSVVSESTKVMNPLSQ